MTKDVLFNLPEIKDYFISRHATVTFISSSKIAICTVKANYIPITDFKNLFTEISILIKRENIKKFIFDKRLLTIFHQPSMEWYHLNWKEDMYKIGLKSHRKLLPNDKLFEQSVITGRKKIAKENPHFNYNKYDIMYCTTLEEAIEK